MAEKLHRYKPGRISGSEKVLPEELPSREKLFKIPIAFSRVPIHTLDRRMGVVVHILPTIAKNSQIAHMQITHHMKVSRGKIYLSPQNQRDIGYLIIYRKVVKR